MSFRKFGLTTTALFAAALVSSPANAKEWQVTMVNRGVNGAMDYTPAFLKIAPGDTVRFVATDKTHNAESIPELTPAGGNLFKGKLNQDVVVTFSKSGLYGYKCLPHLGMGMVGLVQVGKAVNRASFTTDLAKLPPLARKRMTAFLARAN